MTFSTMTLGTPGILVLCAVMLCHDYLNVMLSDCTINVVILIPLMLNVLILSVIMLNVIMLSVMAPIKGAAENVH
jgi:hypothetical protein